MIGVAKFINVIIKLSLVLMILTVFMFSSPPYIFMNVYRCVCVFVYVYVCVYIRIFISLRVDTAVKCFALKE